MALLDAIDGSKKVSLEALDPNAHGGLDKDQTEVLVSKLQKEICELQELLYAAQTDSLLIVLQGLDTSGKDGTISHAMSSMNPQSCRVASFKVPTPVEAAHDFLWRVHAETPGMGSTVIFNRSHYEDVLVVRVHKLITTEECRRRYDHINNFERLLADNDTIILKFFLDISKDEQEQRLREREKDPTKAWKLNAGDWKERELWDDYRSAYQDAINRCAAPHAPWYVVPANHKWFRNLAITDTIARTLRPHKKRWLERLTEIGAAGMAELRIMRQRA